MKDISAELAHYEIGWWKAAHRKDEDSFIQNMAKLYELQYRQFHIELSSNLAVKAAKYRLKAAKEHDIAEKLEDSKNQTKADIHWNKAERFLKKHFKILQKPNK